MKILYIGCYRDNTGWGHMALNTISALIAGGGDVTARPVKLNNSQMELPQHIIEAENKRGGQFDVVIENVLPHSMEYCGKIPLNIGYYCTETNRFDGTVWPQKINTLDKAWVCSEDSYEASRESGVDIPIDVMPIAADVSKYQRKYKNLSIRDRFRDSFIFYYIGEFNTRKNIRALIQAFHLEFDPNEPVELVLKTKTGPNLQSKLDEIRSHEKMIEEIDTIKYSMKLYRDIADYKQEIVLNSNYTEEQIMRLHSSCDCFVCPSHGEAWCVPAFDAMSMGKTPIVSNVGGFLEYMTYETGYLVSGREQPVWAMTKDTFEGLYTSRENWYDVDMYSLRAAMRSAYRDSEDRKRRSMAGRKRAYDFSYDKVGHKMMENLSCQFK